MSAWTLPRCRLWSALAWVVLIALATCLSGCGREGSSSGTAASGGYTAIDITGATYASKLELPDPDGRVRRLDEFKGKVVIVFFGFTQCPDVCPTTLNDIAQVRQALGEGGQRVQPVFVTVDPQRDTPELLKAYVANFGPDVVALRGDEEQTKAAAKEFKVFFARSAGKTPDTYTIDHTAGAWVFDPQGRVRLYMRHGQTVADMKADIGRLLAGG